MHQTPLRQYQIDGVRRIHESDGRHILADEMSLGKTLQSLYYGWRYLPADTVGPMIAVVPSHLKINWAKEAENHLGQHIETLWGQRVPADKQPPLNPNQIYAVNYDILVPPRWNPRTALPADSWAGWLSSLNPRYIIGDEAQMLRNSATQRSRAFRKMSRGVPHVVLLTGTPVANNPMDLWALLNITRPDLYPSRWEFGTRWTNAVRRPWGWEFPGGRDLDLLHKELIETHGVMTRRRVADVAGQLPPMIQTVIPIRVDLTEYRKAETDFLNWLAKQDTLAAQRAAMAEQLSRMNYLRRLAGELKIPAVVDWVWDFLDGSESKLLLGAYHKKVTHALIAEFGDAATLVDGELDGREKARRTDVFNTPSSPIRVMVGNLQSAGTGWNCTVTGDAVICELDWLPGTHAQFMGRIHGLNRGIPGVVSHVRWLIAEDTVEGDICEMLMRKQRYSDLAVDGIASGDQPNLVRMVAEAMQARRGLSVPGAAR